MDPAGPKFDVDKVKTRLAESDAEYVDVIHTDVGLGEGNFGMEEPIGHADFYPNGFRIKQPGCYTPGTYSFYSHVVSYICATPFNTSAVYF